MYSKLSEIKTGRWRLAGLQTSQFFFFRRRMPPPVFISSEDAFRYSQPQMLQFLFFRRKRSVFISGVKHQSPPPAGMSPFASFCKRNPTFCLMPGPGPLAPQFLLAATEFPGFLDPPVFFRRKMPSPVFFSGNTPRRGFCPRGSSFFLPA